MIVGSVLVLLFLLLTWKQGMQPLGSSWKDAIQFMVLMAGSQALAESVLEGSHLRDEGVLFAYRMVIAVSISSLFLIVAWLLRRIGSANEPRQQPLEDAY